MSKTLHVKVGSKALAAKEFIRAWHQSEQSENKEPQSDQKLYFESADSLLRTLTPKRLELLRTVRQAKSISIRALAKQLQRDYKNVHQDTQCLSELGLIMKGHTGSLTVPWQAVAIEIPMNSQPRSKKTGVKKRAAG